MGANLPDYASLVQAGIDPKTKLPIKVVSGEKCMLKENLKEYLQKQGFYLSTIKDWKKCLASENWEGDTPVFVTDDQNHEVEITWENISKNDTICVTDECNMTVWIYKKEIIEAVENFDFDEG